MLSRRTLRWRLAPPLPRPLPPLPRPVIFLSVFWGGEEELFESLLLFFLRFAFESFDGTERGSEGSDMIRYAPLSNHKAIRKDKQSPARGVSALLSGAVRRPSPKKRKCENWKVSNTQSHNKLNLLLSIYRNGPYQADCPQEHRRQGAAQAAGHQGGPQVRPGHRRVSTPAF